MNDQLDPTRATGNGAESPADATAAPSRCEATSQGGTGAYSGPPTSPHRPGWDRYFLTIAAAVATRSDCRRAQVGAVIVDTRHRIISTGYVGAPAGQPGCLDGSCPRGLLTADECRPGSAYDNCISHHVEVNAVLYSDRSRHEGGTIYVTREPCGWCAKVIEAAGIVRVVYAVDGGGYATAPAGVDPDQKAAHLAGAHARLTEPATRDDPAELQARASLYGLAINVCGHSDYCDPDCGHRPDEGNPS